MISYYISAMWFWFWSDIISAMIYPDTELRHGCLCNFYLMCIVCNSAGVSPGETPPPEGRENCFLNFLTTFLVVTIQQVNLQTPLSALSRCDYFFAPTWHFTTIWSPFTPVRPPPVGDSGGGGGLRQLCCILLVSAILYISVWC